MGKRVTRVLVVDDDPTMLTVIREVLAREKFSVSTARGGREGIKSFNQSPFDLVLLDIDMPEISGFEVLTHIRSHSPDVKVIMVTGLDDLEHGMRAVESGANGYITKPFNAQDFVYEVKRVLEG